MLEEARVILKQVETAETGVRRRARGETGQLVVGSAGATYFHPLIPAIIRKYRMSYPDIVLAPHDSNTSLLVARLHAGQVDIALIRPPIDSADGLAIEPLVNEELRGHPAKGASIVQPGFGVIGCLGEGSLRHVSPRAQSRQLRFGNSHLPSNRI